MNEIINVIGAVSGFIGAFGGILISSKLSNYRIEQLEQKVDRLNQLIERTGILEEKLSVANHRIEDLEKEVKELAHKRRSED